MNYDTQVNGAITTAIKCRLTGFFFWMLKTSEFPLSYSEPMQHTALVMAIEHRRALMMIQLFKHSEALGLQITKDEPCPLIFVYKIS